MAERKAAKGTAKKAAKTAKAAKGTAPKSGKRAKPRAAKAAKAGKATKRPASSARKSGKPMAKAAEPRTPAEPSAPAGPGSGVEPPVGPPAEAPLEWIPVEAQDVAQAATSTPTPTAAPPAAAPPIQFNPVTGDWIPVPSQPELQAIPPEAPRTGSLRYIFWTIILAIDLVLLALNFLGALAIGVVLYFFPDSAQAEDLRGAFGTESARSLVINQVLAFIMMGIIPFLWVLGTRRVPWEGTKRYLQLKEPVKGILWGIALTPVLIIAVIVLSSIYILITQGPDGFTLVEDEGANPAVDALLEHLTWPIAILIAVTAGVGEEILFRGVLIKRLGVWGQAVLFGLAHSAGAYLPQILFAFGLGVFFGYLVKRGWSLWALITAHFLYDMVLLSLSLLYG